MKNIQSFNDFELNEGLSQSRAKASDAKNLVELAKKTDDGSSEDFQALFVESYGSAADMWMGEEKWEELKKLYAAGKHDFLGVSGNSEDGSSDSRMEDLLDKKWKVFAEEQNEDSYDSILYRTR